MTWTDDDPGAGDVAALRELADHLDSVTRDLVDGHWDVRSHTGTITAEAWAGRAGDAWRHAGGRCVENIGSLIEATEPAATALAAYADELEVIAEEAALARRRRAAAGFELDTLTEPPAGASTLERARWRTARDQAEGDARRADGLMTELVDRRRAADARVRAEMAPVRVDDWEPVGPVSVPAARTPGTPTILGVPREALTISQIALGVNKVATKSVAYQQFLNASTAPLTSYQALKDGWAAADAALDRFRFGKPDGGVVGKVTRSPAVGRALGKLFLPLTVVTGIVDLRTGGGYDGARGAATRGLGLVGAAGAGALLASSPLIGILSLNPVGAAVAGAAVLGYAAWSLGNLVYDNREAIGSFLSSAASTAKDLALDAGSAARAWASSRISTVTGSVSDLGTGALRVLSLGLL